MRPSRYQNSSPALNKQAFRAQINKRFDSMMYSGLFDEYYDHSGFHNFGYWTSTTRNQREASENLVDLLVDFFQNKAGSVLDVACGMGASTQQLLRYNNFSDIIGINISEKQLATCRERIPSVQFLCMDATNLQFADDSIDNILCVEAAALFDTREQFLREAYRVLKPRGCLALSDILIRSRQAASLIKLIPPANFLSNAELYRSLCHRCGFEHVRIVEARAQSWEAFRDNSLDFVWSKVLRGKLPWAVLRQVARAYRLRDWIFSNYLLISAFKPR